MTIPRPTRLGRTEPVSVPGHKSGFPSRLPPELPPDFPTLTPPDRREIVNDLARPRSARASTRERIVHTFEDGDRDHQPALTLVLELDPDRLVKRSAAFGLACIPDRVVVPGLRFALSLPDRATRGHAILALGRLRAREAVPDLAQLLDDSYGRMPAADALVAIGDESALPYMRRAAFQGSLLHRRRLHKRLRLLEARVGSHSFTGAR